MTSGRFGVLLATLNRPEVMNATNARLHWELTKVWGVVNDDDSVKVVVVTGAGDRAFSAGGDLEWVESMVGTAEAVMHAMKEAGDIVYNVKIGRASCRERVCQYVKISVGAVSIKKKKK